MPRYEIQGFVNAVLIACTLTGCAGGQYDLIIEFPDEEARTTTERLDVWVIDPEGVTCGQLIDGDVPATETRVRSHESLTLPKQEASRLNRVPTGRWLFLAEGSNGEGATILRGCTAADVGLGAEVEVVVALVWVCRPDPRGEIPGNSEDDDCDGLTDECVNDGECNDDNACTSDFCAGGTCENTTLPDLSECDDGIYCTVGEVCVSGTCGGGAGRCDDGDICTEDVCDEDLATCDHVPVQDPGFEGPFGDPTCGNNLDDDCDGATDGDDVDCVGCDSPSDCDDDNPCTQDRCVEPVCRNEPLTDGTECDDGDACTVGDTCTGGSCVGSQLDADGDGHVPVECGGDDCDDDAAAVHAGAQEGPPGDPTCADGFDNNCDGRADELDVNCQEFEFCSVDGWCWENPRPQGENLTDIWAAADDDVWFAGPEGTIVQWYHDRFSGIRLGSSWRPSAIWGSSPADVWVMGQDNYVGTIWNWDGATWTEVDNPATKTMLACFGLAQDNIWAVGFGGEVVHWDGVSWALAPSGTTVDLNDVWGASETDLWIVGMGGLILRGDGQTWTPVQSPTTEILFGVHGQASNDVWVVGYGGTILHWDGIDWTNRSGVTSRHLRQVWAVAPDDAWAVGEFGTVIRWDGSNWTTVHDAGETLYDLWIAPSGNVWVSGSYGRIEVWDKSTWNTLDSGSRDWFEDLFVLDCETAWAVGSGSVVQWDGLFWQDLGHQGRAIWASSADDVWVVGSLGRVHRWDGSTWNQVESPTEEILLDVWGCSQDDVWIVGESGVTLHWDGTNLIQMDSAVTSSLTAVYCAGTDDVWALSILDGCLRWTGTGWEETGCYQQGERFLGMWGNSADDIWVAGRGTVLHWNGTNWTEMATNETLFREAIWSPGGTEAWVSGSQGAMEHCAAGTCARQVSGTRNTLLGVGGCDQFIWTVGVEGTFLRMER